MIFSRDYWRPVLSGARRLLLQRRASFTRAEISSRYVYALWMRVLIELQRLGAGRPHFVLEVGPGQSLGLCAAALLTGSNRYLGLDIRPYALPDIDAGILVSLAGLLESREPVPDRREFPRLYPQLEETGFPRALLDDAQLKSCLAPDRMQQLETALRQRRAASGVDVAYRVPWTAADVPTGEVDLVFSQAVMQCIPARLLAGVHEALYRALRPGGIAMHQIDFAFPLATSHWNFHRAYPDTLWYLVDYAREYAVTRLTLSDHLDACRAAGFKILDMHLVRGENGLGRPQVARRFRSIAAEDFDTSGAFLILQR